MNETIEYTHTINVPLMRKMLEHITAHPEEHDQDYWGFKADVVGARVGDDTVSRCGTTACAAGWTCLLAGYSEWVEADEGVWNLLAIREDGTPTYVPDRAQQLLGLNNWQASEMFVCADTRAELWQLASQYTQGEIEIPASMS